MENIKKIKLVFISVFLVFVFLYASFLWILPNSIDLNNYKKDIQKIVFDSAKLNLEFSKVKLVTTPSLKAGVNISDLIVSYPDKKEIVKVDNAEVKISLLPLIFKTLRVSDVYVDSPNLSLEYLKNCQFDIVEYFNKNVILASDANSTSQEELPVNFSNKLPDVIVKNYKLSLKDEKTGNIISINGPELIFDKAEINRHFRIKSKGVVYANKAENISYDLNVYSYWPVIDSNLDSQGNAQLPKFDFINEFVKYNPKALLKADLKVTEHKGHADINGYANIDKMSLILGGKKLPDSYAHLSFDGHNTNIDSNLYVAQNEKATLTANINHGHNLKLDLRLKTDKITFQSIQSFVIALLNSLNIKNDLSSIIADGYISSDFSLKTDTKNFESSGFLKIPQGFIRHKSIPVKIDKIVADLDFSNNALNIKNTGAVVNGTDIKLSGSIDSKSNVNISAVSGNVNLAPLYDAFAPENVKYSYPLKKGILKINAIVKGKLSEIKPDLSIILSDFLMGISGTNAKISLNKAEIRANPQDIQIVPFALYLNSSKISVSGGVKNYLKKPEIKIAADGLIIANDLKSLLPNDVKAFVSAKGSIPLKALVAGDDKKISVNAQALSNSDKYFAPIIVKKMLNKPGLLNVSLLYSDDKLSIEDISLAQTNKTTLSNDYASMTKGSQKVFAISGAINNLSSSNPEMSIDFYMPEALLVSTYLMPTSSMTVRADFDILGSMNNPLLKGFASVTDVKLPEILTSIKTADIELNKDAINIKVNDLNINSSSINLDIDASTKFVSSFLIRKMMITSSLIDVDKLFVAMDKMNKLMATSSNSSSVSKSNNAPVVPCKIQKGTAEIQTIKMKGTGAEIIASSITGDFSLANDLLKINNLKATAYNGTISGNVDYNLANTNVSAKINGKNIDANPAVTAFAGIKDQLIGKADFNANVKLKGVTYEQQMNSLTGKVDFSLADGQMGSLGRFETFLKADNLLSQTFVASKIGSLVSTVAPYNTGKFSYLKGKLDIKNGNAAISPIEMSGPHMSLLITGKMNLLSMISNLTVMGSLSPEVVSALGPVGNLSVEKIASYIPKFGTAIASAMNNYNQAANNADLAKIPALTPKKDNTKSFKVLLNGNLNNPPSTVKQFKWLNSQQQMQEQEKSLLDAVKPKLPATKEELKQQVKEDLTNAIQQTETVQKIKENKAVQTLGAIYNFYKNNGSKEESVQKQ